MLSADIVLSHAQFSIPSFEIPTLSGTPTFTGARSCQIATADAQGPRTLVLCSVPARVLQAGSVILGTYVFRRKEDMSKRTGWLSR